MARPTTPDNTSLDLQFMATFLAWISSKCTKQSHTSNSWRARKPGADSRQVGPPHQTSPQTAQQFPPLDPRLVLACLWRISLMKCLLRSLVFVALATTCIADSIVYVRVHRPLIVEHLKLANDGEAERVRTLRSL